MSGRIFVAPHHSTEELERRYKAANDGIERGHLHIIWLLSQGRSAKFVAEVSVLHGEEEEAKEAPFPAVD